MFTANYEALREESKGNDTQRTRTKYRKPIAFVYGTERGVPFRVAAKTMKAVNNALRRGFEVVYA